MIFNDTQGRDSEYSDNAQTQSLAKCSLIHYTYFFLVAKFLSEWS